MTTLTLLGNITETTKWIGYAKSQQRMMRQMGNVKLQQLSPVTGLSIRISINPDTIQITAQVNGYEFSVHKYPVSGSTMNVSFFLDEKEDLIDEGVPSEPVNKQHLNLWYGNKGKVVSGCKGRRYGAGVAWSASSLISDEITERLPSLFENRTKTLTGDIPVAAAALVYGQLTGVTLDGKVYRWQDGVSELIDLGLGLDLSVYWVFNKEGNECSGVDYDHTETDKELKNVTIKTIIFTNEDGVFSAILNSIPTHINNLAVDYDYTEKDNPLISCEFITSKVGKNKHLPGWIGDDNDYDTPYRTYSDPATGTDSFFNDKIISSIDSVIRISRSINSEKPVDNIPFLYNFVHGGFVEGELNNPTDVGYKGRLLCLDLRFRAYGIYNKGFIPDPDNNESQNQITGNFVDFVVNGISLAHIGTYNSIPSMGDIDDKLDANNPPLMDYNTVDLMQVPGVSPDFNNMAIFIRSSYNPLFKDIDFMSKSGVVDEGYHSRLKDTLDSLGYSSVLISTYNSWT